MNRQLKYTLKLRMQKDFCDVELHRIYKDGCSAKKRISGNGHFIVENSFFLEFQDIKVLREDAIDWAEI